ncbi:Uncharacterised protein [Janthinobacterium lividum]|nr:hypothetical protein JANLI_55510 [Janthinobacterium lividum]STQ96439.1 Uncharacterised protein [Janthinobacterium lividum]
MFFFDNFPGGLVPCCGNEKSRKLVKVCGFFAN